MWIGRFTKGGAATHFSSYPSGIVNMCGENETVSAPSTCKQIHRMEKARIAQQLRNEGMSSSLPFDKIVSFPYFSSNLSMKNSTNDLYFVLAPGYFR